MAIDFKAIDKKKLAVILLAVGAGLIAMVLTNNYITTTSNQKAKILAGGMTSEETKKLLSRLENIEKMNQELVTRQSALAQQTQALAQAQATGKTQPKLPSQQSLAVKTPAGKRAITVVVDKLYAVGGMISPGDYVDVLVHLQVPSGARDGRSETTTLTLFQNVLVLAIGINMQAGTGYEIQQAAASLPVTFALNPQEASLISFAQEHGSIQLLLRPPTESQAYILQPATWGSLSEYIMATQGTTMGIRADTIDKPKARIEIYRGGKVSEQ